MSDDDRFVWDDLDVQPPGKEIGHYSSVPEHPVLFYGGPLSNFTGGPFMVMTGPPVSLEEIGIEAQTVEHFFQAAKATNFEDVLHVLQADDPADAKRRGRRIELRPDWDVGDDPSEWVAWHAMLHGLRAKFADPGFAEWLRWTGDRLIAEDSPTDFRWGIRDDRGGWNGMNLLGKALMVVREEIR